MEAVPTVRLLDEFHQHRLGREIEDAHYAEADIAFFDDLVAGAIARGEEIDALLEERLAQGWSLARLDRTMLQILRAGSYELLARPDVPVASVIGEYLDIAHAFFEPREAKFVNGRARCGGQGGAAVDRSLVARLMDELGFIQALRGLAGEPEARGLADDAAVLEIGGEALVITHDTMVEGVHFLASQDPADVAFKLAAVNASDLAAKGARPMGALLSYTLSDWNARFLDGLGDALAHFGFGPVGR